jgi:hypothetical protein
MGNFRPQNDPERSLIRQLGLGYFSSADADAQLKKVYDRSFAPLATEYDEAIESHRGYQSEVNTGHQNSVTSDGLIDETQRLITLDVEARLGPHEGRPPESPMSRLMFSALLFTSCAAEVAPRADAGDPRVMPVGAVAALDGSFSEGDGLSYAWSVDARRRHAPRRREPLRHPHRRGAGPLHPEP